MARDERETINLIDEVNAIYQTQHICNTDLLLADSDLPDFETDFEEWITNIYNNKPVLINRAVLQKTANTLAQGITTGLATNNYVLKDAKLIETLINNTWQFSGFKTLAQGIELRKLLVDESGQVRSFSSFKAEAQKVGNVFNKNWLQTEYQHAIAASQSASNWESFKLTKKALPLLQYDTAQDDRVRPEHAALQGVTKPINDSFWNSFYPPNGFGCRCGVRQLADGDITPNEKINYPDEKGVPLAFRNNVGKTGEAFPQDLPFFKAPIGYVNLVQKEIKAAKNNANN